MALIKGEPLFAEDKFKNRFFIKKHMVLNLCYALF